MIISYSSFEFSEKTRRGVRIGTKDRPILLRKRHGMSIAENKFKMAKLESKALSF